MRRNIEKAILKREINPYYDMNYNDMMYFANKPKYDGIASAFCYGYEMGTRAAKAEQKRKGKRKP